MKEYTTLEALKAITENPKLVFEDIHNGKGTRMGYTEGFSGITWIYPDGTYKGGIILCSDFFDRKWTIAEQPVSFMEAINSGKQIKAEGWNDYHFLSTVFSILSSERDAKTMCDVINGKWYIEEAEE